jgi:hypothetical protein
MFGNTANYEIHYKLCASFIGIWILIVFVRNCITQYKYMVSTIEELKRKCENLQKRIDKNDRICLSEYEDVNVRVDELQHQYDDMLCKYNDLSDFVYYKVDELNESLARNISTTNSLSSKLHTMDILLSTVNDDVINVFKSIDSKQHSMSNEVGTLKTNIELCEKQLFDIPKYIGNLGGVGQIKDPIFTTATRLSQVFNEHVWVASNKTWASSNACIRMDKIIKSNIKLLDFNNIHDVAGMYIQIDGHVFDILHLLNCVRNPLNIGNTDIRPHVQLLHNLKEICDDNDIEIEFPKIDDLFAGYL